MAKTKSKSQKRRRATTPRPVTATTAGSSTATPVNGKMISWRHCIVGLVVGEVLLLLLSNFGLGITNAAFGTSLDGGVVGVASLLAVLAGAYVAARLAGRQGMWQGIVVGIGFIAVGAIFQFLQEASIVHSALASGSHTLVDLGPMSMGNLMTGDLLALFGGSLGGLLARRP